MRILNKKEVMISKILILPTNTIRNIMSSEENTQADIGALRVKVNLVLILQCWCSTRYQLGYQVNRSRPFSAKRRVGIHLYCMD